MQEVSLKFFKTSIVLNNRVIIIKMILITPYEVTHMTSILITLIVLVSTSIIAHCAHYTQ